MAQKTRNPAALACADRARKCDCFAAVTSENITNPGEFQSLGNAVEGVVADLSTARAAWIMSRFPVTPQTARAVAELAFGKGAAR